MNQFVFKALRSPAIGGAVYMTLAGLFFALVNIAVQAVAMQHGVPSSSVAFWQYLIAFLFAVPWLIRSGTGQMHTRQIGLHVLRVVFAAAGVQLWVLGLAYVPIWQAIALIMTSPFFVTAGAGLLLGERVGPARWLAVAVGFTGGMIILEPWSEAFRAATLLPLAASLLWAMSSLVVKKLTDTESPQTVTVYLLILLTPINAAIALAEGFTLPMGTPLVLIAVAGLLTVAAQLALTKAYALADAAYVQPFDHLKLPLNVFLGWWAFSFVPEGSLWLGAILIVGASLYIVQQESTAERRLGRDPLPERS